LSLRLCQFLLNRLERRRRRRLSRSWRRRQRFRHKRIKPAKLIFQHFFIRGSFFHKFFGQIKRLARIFFLRKLFVIQTQIVICIRKIALNRNCGAEVHFSKYLSALLANQGRTAYEELNAASGANPASDLFATELSRVNFQLAISLNAQKKLTDQDRQNISVLVNQSVQAASRATQINQNKLSNWENLANIYQALITTDPAAANLSAQAYLQAVSLDPQDPMLRLRFAQMLYSAKAQTDILRSELQPKPDKPI